MESEINVQCCWYTPSPGWNQFAKRFVQEGHLYSIYLVYRDSTGKWGPKWEPKVCVSVQQQVCRPHQRAFVNCTQRMNKQSGKLWPDPGKCWSFKSPSASSPQVQGKQGVVEYCSGSGQQLSNTKNWRLRTSIPSVFWKHSWSCGFKTCSNNIGHNHLVSVGLVLISNTLSA